MVGYECRNCGGSGYEEITIVRKGDVTTRKEECAFCFGTGSFTNGRPDTGYDVGITDPFWDFQRKGSDW